MLPLKEHDDKPIDTLFSEIKNNRIQKVDNLLRQMVDVNVRDKSTGQTPLMVAIQYKRIELIRFIINYRLEPDFSIADEDGRTVSEYLRSNKFIDKTLQEDILRRYLFQSVKKNDFARVIKLRDSKLISFTVKDPETENSPLHYAAQYGQVDLIDLLHENYEISNKRGYKPIDTAAHYGQYEMVIALLKKGVNSTRVLIIACDAKQTELMRLLIASPYSKKLVKESKDGIAGLLHKSVISGQVNIIHILTEYDLRSCDNWIYEDTYPMHWAVLSKQSASLEKLFELNFSCGKLNKTGQTPKQLALALMESAVTEEEKTAYKQFFHRLEGLEQAAASKLENLLKNTNKILEIFKSLLQVQKSWKFLQTEFDVFNKIFTHTIELARSNSQTLQKYLTETHSPESLEKFTTYLTGEFQKNETEFFESKKKSHVINWNKACLSLNEALCNNPELEPKNVDLPVKLSLLEEKDGVQQNRSEQCLEEFIREFEKQFDHAFCKFQSIYSGELRYIPDNVDKAADLGKQLSQVLPTVGIPGTPISIPLGPAVSVAISFGLHIREYYRQKEAKIFCDLFATIGPFERTAVVRAMAEKIALKYRHQLSNLVIGETGVLHFARCAVIRIVDYIVAKDAHQIASQSPVLKKLSRTVQAWWTQHEIPSQLDEIKSFEQLFLDGLGRVTDKYEQEKRPLGTIRLSVKAKPWISRGIFENTGIIVETQGSQKRWAHPDCDIMTYGYCYGSVEEAKNRRGFSALTSNGQAWPDKPELGSHLLSEGAKFKLTLIPSNTKSDKVIDLQKNDTPATLQKYMSGQIK